MVYYVIKNKSTGLWDICTNNAQNPPLEKYRWAVDFNTEEEAKGYLQDTLKKLKYEKLSIGFTPYDKSQPFSSPNKTVGIVNGLLRYAIWFAIIIGIIWVASFFRTSTNSSSPELNNSWVTQLFQNVSIIRNQTISNCNNLNFYAILRYNTLKNMSSNPSEWDYFATLSQDEIVLAPIQLQPPAPYSYTLSYPKTYLNDNLNNYTQFFDSYYSYYGYAIYPITGIFNSSTDVTAPTQHVLIELSHICPN